MLLLVLAGQALAQLPLPTYPQCGEPDRPDLCPDDLEEQWNFLSYVPTAWQADISADERALGAGMSIDRAWRTTTGRPDVTIAVIDTGIRWDSRSLLRKHALNAAELPVPDGAADHDANGDGIFNIDDYADDARVDPTSGADSADDVLDPSDLIAAFSDGVDDDANGYTDDIAGWDFYWNDNDPYDDVDAGHGTGMAHDATDEGGDGDGDIGSCPSCMLLNIRAADGFVADLSVFPQALSYAVDRGASAVVVALGGINEPGPVRAAVDDAWDNGTLVIGSAGDEHAWHANPPGASPHTFYVHALRYDGDGPSESTSFLAYSNCTNHGARLDGSASSDDCSSGASGMTGGIAGLIVSAARDAGWEPTAAEVHAMLTGTVDDVWVQGRDDVYPSLEGWDRYFGYGRINAARAVAEAAAGPPPVADLLAPGFYAWLDASRTPTVDVTGVASAAAGVQRWTLEWGTGIEPTTWSPIADGSAAADGPLATWTVPTIDGDLQDYAPGDDTVDRESEVNRFTATLRLSVTDAAGRTTVARRAVTLRQDPDLLPAFPLTLSGSLEASPMLYDLDGDGAMEVIQATGSGLVYALRGDGSTFSAAWPVHTGLVSGLDPEDAANHLAAAAYGRVSREQYEAITATPVVADLDGDGTAEIAVASMRGAVWVYEADGSVRPGFPVYQDEVGATSPDRRLARGFLSSPSLADLDGDGRLELVVGGMDQQLYAWTADGAPAPGFPALLSATGAANTRIISSPAVGDLDGDGLPEVILGTNEQPSDAQAYLYAVHGDGTLVEGWPERMPALSSDILPVVGEGFPDAAALGDLDGDGAVDLLAHTMTGQVQQLAMDGETIRSFPFVASAYGEQSNVNDAAIFPLINAPSLGDLDGDGVLDVVTAGTGSGYLLAQSRDGQRMPYDHGVGAWSGADGTMLPGWPRVMEDMQFFQNPAIADIDGDRAMEVLVGSGGSVLHAWNKDGVQPAGWPKLVGAWLIASPAVGDIDGDGLLDVVVGTRDGRLFAWSTPSPAGADVAWPMFGHDAQHTRDARTPLPGYNAGYGEDEEKPEAEGCGCGQEGRVGAVGVLLLVGLAGARRRKP